MDEYRKQIKWQNITRDSLCNFSYYTADIIKGKDEWELSAIKNACALDLPGAGVDVRCEHIDELLPVFYDSTLNVCQIIERLYPQWRIESQNNKWLRLISDNDMVEFELIGNEIGYISMFWLGEQ
ncbi:MAG: hypothetical protein MJ009_07875, partial [Paludibacteraceae bacterium]|nr:hypothetical protein [Paludibacteraceae bacterium]